MEPDRKYFGKCDPQYRCLINPFVDCRFSRCPSCDGRTQMRKFALVIHVDPKGIFPTRLTCRRCKACGLVIVHKSDLEETLQHGLATQSPSQVGNRYFIIGTMEIKKWKQFTDGDGTLEDAREWTSDFVSCGEIERGTAEANMGQIG